MKILLCNDDGIDSIGLKALIDIFKDDHEVYVVAPNKQYSGAGHSITIGEDLYCEKRNIEGVVKAFAVHGTPADCAFAAIRFLNINPDVVISGINDGDNLSSDCISSGTVGAALEAFIQGYPAIAVSLTRKNEGTYKYPAQILKRVLDEYMKLDDKNEYILNLNVPYEDKDKIKGIKIVKFDGIRNYGSLYYTKEDENCIIIKQNLGIKKVIENTFDSIDYDITADNNGYITISPLNFDLVVHHKIKDILPLEKINID